MSEVPLIRALVWIYIVGSVVLLFAVQRTRVYPLYLLKSAWVGFTLLAFGWIVMMSGATNEHVLRHPAGVYEALTGYPEAFRALYRIDAWWLPLAVAVALWVAGGLLAPRRTAQRRARIALAGVATLACVPIISLLRAHDWTAYGHFRENYGQAWRVARMGDYFLNSVLVTCCAVVLVTILGAMTAYGLTRLEFRGRRVIMAVMVAAMAVPASLLLVPLFLMMKDWTIGAFSFSNSRVGLAVIYAATLLPFTTFLLSAFFESLPRELAKAASMDGAKPWTIFSDIYFPLAMPGLATAAIFNFLAIWNEYNYALVFLTNPEYKTLPVGLYTLRVSQIYAANWSMLCAGLVILVFPTFLIFVCLQERIVAGLTVGGVKE